MVLALVGATLEAPEPPDLGPRMAARHDEARRLTVTGRDRRAAEVRREAAEVERVESTPTRRTPCPPVIPKSAP